MKPIAITLESTTGRRVIIKRDPAHHTITSHRMVGTGSTQLITTLHDVTHDERDLRSFALATLHGIGGAAPDPSAARVAEVVAIKTAVQTLRS